MEISYIVIAIIALILIAIIFFLGRKKEEKSKSPTNLAMLGIAFVLASIIFGNGNRFLGYSLIGIGVILAVIDIFNRSKK